MTLDPTTRAVLVYALLPGPRGTETRCRKCGYILRGISEPRSRACDTCIGWWMSSTKWTRNLSA